MWTKDQSNAIYAPVGDILVTAAAGSGKTAVMVERIINRIVGDNPTDVDRMLVVTYTNAAAAEIKERIMNEIIKKLDEKEDENLKRQLVLMNNASICTIHSFCLDVVRRNFNILGIDPNVKIGNTNDLELYEQKAVDLVMDRHYDACDSDFISLVRAYSGKSDEGIVELIRKIYAFSRSIPDSNGWLDSLDADNDKIREKYLPVLLSKVKAVCSRAAGIYDKILSLCNTDDYLKGFTDFFENEREPVYKASLCDNWDKMFDILSCAEFKRLVITNSKSDDSYTCERIKSLRGEAKDSVKKAMTSILNGTEESKIADILGQSVYVKKLVELVKETAEEYTNIKLEKSVIDFSDFEHLCLKALSDNGNQSEAAVEVMNRFDEIYIDEYQDCNTVQEEIFKLISGANKGKPNVFVVGDMKQSIYKFRDANPKLIKAKSDEFSLYDEENINPQSKITLNMNFRSRPEVLDCVNSVFRQLMTEQMGELDYTSDEFLYNGNHSYTETIEDNKSADIVIIDSPDYTVDDYSASDDDEDGSDNRTDYEEYGSMKAEAVYIASRIQSMIADSNYRVYDKKIDGYRHIEYRDIVILMKSIKSNTNPFSEVFEQAGIPLFTDVKGYFESREITFIMDLLRVIDNPLDDIPLAAVMRHPVFGFSDNQLMTIRGFSKRTSYYHALTKSADLEWDSRKKCAFFVGFLRDCYNKSKYMSVNELLGYITEKIDYMTYLGTLENAATAKSNVKMLFHKAKEFESNNFRGIFNFVNYVELIKKHGSDSDSAKTLGESDNVVRVMTIHKSKGLEFPVVFLARTSTKFYKKDIDAGVLLHKDLGIGMNVVDTDRRIKYSSAAREAIRTEANKELVSEELRVLYVALTRAREKLIVTSYIKNASSTIEKISKLIENEDEIISPEIVLGAKSYIDWLLMASLRNPSCDLTDDLYAKAIDDGSRFTCSVIPENMIKLNTSTLPEADFDEVFTKSDDAEVEKRLSYTYPYSRLSSVPRNISVTELKRMAMGEQEDAGSIFRRKPVEKPLFMQESDKAEGARRGTVMHLVMQHIDFTKTDRDEIERQIINMKEKGMLTHEEFASVDVSAICDFVSSPLGLRIAANYSRFYREFSFKYLMKVKDIYPDTGCDDDIIVQGVIDGYFEDEFGNIVLIDYKTDRIVTDSADIAMRYREQIKYYSIALEKLLKKAVSESYIYLFDSGETIKM